MLDFNFDDEKTQHYLSLGLTPLSQLSPPESTPQSSGTDSCFFPSMPPPVTPISSVFSMNSSGSSGVGIPVDTPFHGQPGPGGMVMPDANPVGDPPTSARRLGRRGKHEATSHSQGYAMKLEPVMEQSCSLDDSDVFTNPKVTTNGIESSSSSAEDPGNALLAIVDSRQPTSNFRRKTAKRRKSGTRRKLEEEDWELTVIGNKNLSSTFDFPVKLSAEDSPRQEGRKLRQQIREQELARQKQKLRLMQLEEEKKRLMQQEQRAAQIAQDYSSTRQREGERLLSPHGGGLVLEQAMRFEAQAQMLQNLETSPHRHHNRKATDADAEPIVNTSNQFSVL